MDSPKILFNPHVTVLASFGSTASDDGEDGENGVGAKDEGNERANEHRENVGNAQRSGELSDQCTATPKK
jgi:hypothetical protein